MFIDSNDWTDAYLAFQSGCIQVKGHDIFIVVSQMLLTHFQ